MKRFFSKCAAAFQRISKRVQTTLEGGSYPLAHDEEQTASTTNLVDTSLQNTTLHQTTIATEYANVQESTAASSTLTYTTSFITAKQQCDRYGVEAQYAVQVAEQRKVSGSLKPKFE